MSIAACLALLYALGPDAVLWAWQQHWHVPVHERLGCWKSFLQLCNAALEALHRKPLRSSAPCMQAMVTAWQTGQGQLLGQLKTRGQAGSRLPGA